MKRWLCGALAALMALTTGVLRHPESGLHQRDAHSATPQADGESNTIRVGSYQEAGERPDLPHRPGNRGGSHPL